MCAPTRCGRHLADCQDRECPTHWPVKEAGPAILYVYGTLRPGEGGTVEVPGELYDLGWFPGVRLGSNHSTVTCEKIEVADIRPVDEYEGYNPSNPEGSLFIRRSFLDGFIYEFNGTFNPDRLVQSGDWLQHTREQGIKRHVRTFAC